MEGSSLLGFFQLKVMVFPVMDSIAGVPSGGSGSISGEDDSAIRRLEMFLIRLCPKQMCLFKLLVCMRITCDIEMSVAGGLADFVRDDTLVDSAVGVAHGADDQAVDVTNYRRERNVYEVGYTGQLASLSSFLYIQYSNICHAL